MTDYDLTIVLDKQGQLYTLPGIPSQHGLKSHVAMRFTLGEETAIIHCVGFDATPEQIQRLARRMLMDRL